MGAPQLREAPVREAEEGHMALREPEPLRGGERLALAELAERQVVDVGRLLQVEVLLRRPGKAVAVRHEDDAHGIAGTRQPVEEPTRRERFVVGVGREEEHPRVGRERERRDRRARLGLGKDDRRHGERRGEREQEDDGGRQAPRAFRSCSAGQDFSRSPDAGSRWCPRR